MHGARSVLLCQAHSACASLKDIAWPWMGTHMEPRAGCSEEIASSFPDSCSGTASMLVRRSFEPDQYI